jgi:N-formylglutamate deformylase
MDEKRYERSANFERVVADLETLADRVAEIPSEELRPYRSAAE